MSDVLQRLDCTLPMRWLIHIAFSIVLLCAAVPPLSAQTSDAERKIRNVTPENIPVIILPPRQQENSKSRATEEPIPGDSLTALVSEDGVVRTAGATLRFIGIAAVPGDTLCENANGGRWACGLRAYVALRNFVHGKEIKCEALAVRGGATISRCFRERMNISEWMLGEGWAFYDETARDEALLRSAEDAQKQARGIWANGSQPVKR